MDSFEALLERHRQVIEALVHYRIANSYDAQDVLQETLAAAFQNLNHLKDEAMFKPWLIRIAQNKINDYYRKVARRLELPIEAAEDIPLSGGQYSHEERMTVHDVLSGLKSTDQQILYLYYFQDLAQEEIANRLQIPLGTVKSRLHYAKESFKEKYTS